MSTWVDYARRALERPFSMELVFLVLLDADGTARRRFVPASMCLDAAMRMKVEYDPEVMTFGAWHWPPDATELPDVGAMLDDHIAVALEQSSKP
jgi:hypothetical protein